MTTVKNHAPVTTICINGANHKVPQDVFDAIQTLAAASARVPELESLLIRTHSKFLSILHDINVGLVPYDGDDFHELLRDVGVAIMGKDRDDVHNNER